MTTDKIDNADISAVQLLQDINSGFTNPKLLDKPNRQRCVELLIAEGYRHAQISQVLKVSEKTIARDIKDIKVHNELTPNIGFAKQAVGDLFQKAMNHHAYLMRLARLKEANISEKVQAEFAAWRILREFVERMQTLGYLPLKPQQLSGDIYHHVLNEEGSESLDEVKKMLLEIETVAKETNSFTPELSKDIKRLSNRIEKTETVIDVKKLAEKQKQQLQDKEDENEQ